MRGLIQFLIFLAIVFFVVGEFFGGWYLGVPPHTPLLVYKKTHTATESRRTTTAQEFPFSFEGQVQQGRVTVEGSFERPDSFQTGQRGTPERVVFRQEFREGEPIRVSQTMKQGSGVYRVRLIFEDATGTFRLDLPPAGTL